MKLKAVLTSKDIPVLLIGYNRPELIERRLIELSQMEIKHLYISIDGGLKGNYSKFEFILSKTRNLFINMETFKVNYYKRNLGMVEHINLAINKVFEEFNYVIIVEDDISLSNNFYVNMVNGFNTQSKNNLTGIVGAFSPLELSRLKIISNRWRITSYVPIWGWGCSSYLWSQYNKDLSKEEIKDNLSKSKSWQSLSEFQKNVWLNRFYKIQKSPNLTWDVQLQYLSFLKNFQNLVPLSRFIENEGFSDLRAVHTKGTRPRWLGKESLCEGVIGSNKIMKNSMLFSRMIDSNTYAGDTKYFHLWYRLKQNSR